ncbi:amino acid--tRNA ligase-related protein [Actinomadura terrae]|uniref:amino acid--tRNA ligase-related protein n=1 Tax=Actinomadura terrae TaxID=604353 RepID=UPI001FA77FA1|nr:amino acid--tRNA ligase-related protein [Actinomadura terrae]
MSCSTRDRRFPAQRVPYERWQAATTVNLVADHLRGYDPWTMAFMEGKPEWAELRERLLSAGPDDLADLVAKGRQESLAFLVMMMTGACNADCPICFTDRRAKRGETTAEQRDAVLRQAAELGAGYVYVPGEGEPTIDRGWWRFLDSCKEHGLEAIVFTNGLVFSDPFTSRKYWDCEPEDVVARLDGYPVSFYMKMWSTEPDLVGTMMGIDASKYRFTDYNGVQVPVGMARLMDEFPRDRLGVEVVVEHRNADEVADTIVPFAEEHGLAQIIEIIQHNGRTLGNASYDPTPEQAARVEGLLSPTSCSMGTCKAVVTSRGYLSPRIAILESQLPSPARHVDDGDLWDLLHSTDYIVQRRYETSCLCETEPVSLAQEHKPTVRGPRSVVPPALVRTTADASTVPGDADLATAGKGEAVNGTGLPFQATATVASVCAGETAHGDEVRVVGRATTAGPSLLTLADGPETVTVTGADAPEGAWVGVTGQWDAAACALRASEVTVIKQALRPASGPIAAEFAWMRDPGRLQAVIDRAQMMNLLRTRLSDRGFVEAVTPFLQAQAEMGHVEQAMTEPIGGRRFHLRTDPEEYLKRYLTAGLPAVFELSTNVRAETPDDGHLVEFYSLEYYRRLMTFEESLTLSDELVRECLRRFGGDGLRWEGAPVRVNRPFPRVTYSELFKSTFGVDILAEDTRSAAGLADALRAAGCEIKLPDPLVPWRRAWLEEAMDAHVLPGLRQPLWVTHFPADLALHTRLDPSDERVALRSELYFPGGLELAHAYENLVDGPELRARYDARRSHRVASGMPHVATNEALMISAEAGMPPMSGAAIGVDRILMVALGRDALGAGLLFAREGFTQIKAPASVCGTDGGCGSCGGGCH